MPSRGRSDRSGYSYGPTTTRQSVATGDSGQDCLKYLHASLERQAGAIALTNLNNAAVDTATSLPVNVTVDDDDKATKHDKDSKPFDMQLTRLQDGRVAVSVPGDPSLQQT